MTARVQCHLLVGLGGVKLAVRTKPASPIRKTRQVATPVKKRRPSKPDRREILLEWIVDVQGALKVCNRVFFHAVFIIDRCEDKRVWPDSEYQLLGTTAMFIACKYEGFDVKASDFARMTPFTRGAILNMEGAVLKTLEFGLCTYNAQDALETATRQLSPQVALQASFYMQAAHFDVQLCRLPINDLVEMTIEAATARCDASCQHSQAHEDESHAALSRKMHALRDRSAHGFV